MDSEEQLVQPGRADLIHAMRLAIKIQGNSFQDPDQIQTKLRPIQINGLQRPSLAASKSLIYKSFLRPILAPDPFLPWI